jgi:hypothetical protein
MRRRLKMQSSHGTNCRRERVVVLHKSNINAERGIGSAAVGFRKKPTMVAEALWLD